MSSILIASTTTRTVDSGVASLKYGGQVYTPINGILELPGANLRAFADFDPVALPNLVSRLEFMASTTPACPTVTLNMLRNLENPSPDFRYWLLNDGMQGMWQYDPSDTTTPDNLGLCIVTAQSKKRFKRILELTDYIKFSWFGVRPGDDVSDFLPNLAELLYRNGLSDMEVRPESNKAGAYRITKNTTLNPYGLRLRSPRGQATFGIEQGAQLWIAAADCEFDRISFVGQRGTTDVANSTGAVSNDAADYVPYSSVQLSAVAHFNRCDFNSSRGHNIWINGNIGLRSEMFPYGSNSSLSTFRDCNFDYARGSGMYAEGFDANQILFNHYSARDNGLYNMDDNSFLGCIFDGAGHCNNGRVGHMRFSNANNRSAYFGGYEEDGSQSYAEGRYGIFGCRLAGNPHLGSYGAVVNAQQIYGV